MSASRVPSSGNEVVTDEVLGGGRDAEGKEVSSTFAVPTLLLRNMLDSARRANLPRTKSQAFEMSLNPSGTHVIGQATRVFEQAPEGAQPPGYYNWFRAHVQMAMRDGRKVEDWLDFDAEMIGRLFEAAQRPSEPQPYTGSFSIPPAPRWAGSHAFGPVYERASSLARLTKMQGGVQKLPVRQVMAVSEATLLAEAHVLCIPPEQVAVLPEWGDPQEAFDYAAEVVLPFEPLFLDFTGPGGVVPYVEWTLSNPLSLSGALLWKHGDSLMVAPYGWPHEVPGKLIHSLRTDGSHDDYEISAYESPGWFAFNRAPTNEENGEFVLAGEVRLNMADTPFYGDAATCWADAAAGTDPDEPRNLPGYALLPFPYSGVRAEVLAEGDSAAEVVVAWSQMIWHGAVKALAALSITEAVEVEFVDAPMEKRDRKRAEKRRWPIAQTVVIRSHSKRYRESGSTGDEAHYSHRFWRRATVAHYPLGTMMADARPDLVTPCKRQPESNCGFCRKVKRPATIVGPEDKPLVLKTLVRGK